MSYLVHKEKKLPVVKAVKLKQRLLGLIPYSQWPEGKLFWIPHCSSVHTFFMSFSIDIFFTNSKFQITKLFENAGKNQIFFGGLKSQHVFEMARGEICQNQFKKGSVLYVES